MLDLLSGPQTVPRELVLHMMTPLGCNETTTNNEFELLSAEDMADALQTQDVTSNSTPIDRAKLSDLCKNLSVSWGGTFARSFQLTGLRGDSLTPPAPPQPFHPPQPRTRKRKVEKAPPKPTRKMAHGFKVDRAAMKSSNF